VISAGEIGAVAKLVHTVTGDSLSTHDKPLTVAPLSFPEPMLPTSIEPQTKSDLDKLGPAINRLLEEDPTLRLDRQQETGEQLLWAQGENLVAVAIEKLKRKFGAAVVTKSPRIPYRETIRSKTSVQGRHKKQTGGRGQFGEVFLEIEPNPGGGVEFATRVVGGTVPRQYWPGVEKGVRDIAERGPLAGYPVIDFKATLFDGSFHTVDSDEMSFRQAAHLARARASSRRRPSCSNRSWTSKCACLSSTWATSTAT